MFINKMARLGVSTIAIAVTLSANTAHADEAESPAAPIIVVGQQDQPIEIEPRGLAVSLGEEQFAGVNAVNTEDLMKYAPNFFVRKRYAGDSNGVPSFRGTHSTQSARTLAMVDGFVVSNFLGNSFSFAPKWGVVGPGEVRQFDIVYGPYSSRYVGNSMGGIVNITTNDPERTEAFATVQGMFQPYDQFGTHADYWGGSVEGGIGLKQDNGPWSMRLSGRYFRNEGQPMSWYGLVPLKDGQGRPVFDPTAPVVTGAVIDPKQVEAIAEGTGLANLPPPLPDQSAQSTPAVPGSPTNPIFAAQSPAQITQAQTKLKLGYDDGNVTGQFLLAYWHNEDRQEAPDCYLTDANGNVVCEGRVNIGGTTYTAAGANYSLTLRDEYLAGFKLAAPLGNDWQAKLALSTYQIARSDVFTSNGYVAGQTNGAGTLSGMGPTGWYTADLTVERKGDRNSLAFGLTASMYETDNIRWTIPNWQEKTGRSFANETFGKTRILSAWAEDRLAVGSASFVTAGLRLDDGRAYDGGIGRLGTNLLAGQQVFNDYAPRHETAANPTLSFETALEDGTKLQLSLAMATRFPTVGELFQGSLNGDGSFNPDSFDINLKPERSKDANFLIAHNFGQITLTGSAFWQRVNDTIFQFYGFNQNGISSSTYKNIDVTRQFGFELIAETKDWPIAGMNIDANAAYIGSKTIRNDANPAAEGVQFPRIPRWRVNANVRYAVTPKVSTSLGMRYASRPNTDLFGLQWGDTFGFTSELFSLDARINWEVGNGLRLSAGVDNITNDRAWVFHPYPQRSFLVEAGWKL
jgi:iron complex outermembrane receptor protein